MTKERRLPLVRAAAVGVDTDEIKRAFVGAFPINGQSTKF